MKACRHVYHALSMDERRSQFLPTPFGRPKPEDHGRLETLEQVWFRGAHADIGGGYAHTGLSDIALDWMGQAMARHGLAFRPAAFDGLRPDPLAQPHDELVRRPEWRLFGSWPRWHPVPGEEDARGTRLHTSVLQRASDVERQTGRWDLHRLAVGEAVDFTVEARREWHRTGLVIEAGALYRLTYLGEAWRDAQAPACGPDGQDARGVFDLRRWLSGGRRLPNQPWMRLVATVAHPRDWPLRERGLRSLMRLLFRNDPPELVCQLAPLGRHLDRSGACVLIRNRAPGGLLYLFGNDW